MRLTLPGKPVTPASPPNSQHEDDSMYAFELHQPSSVSEAVALLANSDSQALAGGQSLIAASTDGDNIN